MEAPKVADAFPTAYFAEMAASVLSSSTSWKSAVPRVTLSMPEYLLHQNYRSTNVKSIIEHNEQVRTKWGPHARLTPLRVRDRALTHIQSCHQP
eukprot:SAG31_NODE_5768_length_2335_cov_1.471825_2_plen_94_part_00